MCGGLRLLKLCMGLAGRVHRGQYLAEAAELVEREPTVAVRIEPRVALRLSGGGRAAPPSSSPFDMLKGRKIVPGWDGDAYDPVWPQSRTRTIFSSS